MSLKSVLVFDISSWRKVHKILLWEAGEAAENRVAVPEFDLVLLGGGGDEVVGGIFVGPGPKDGLASDRHSDGKNGPGGKREFEPCVWIVWKAAFLPEAIDFHDGCEREMPLGCLGKESGFDAFRKRKAEAEFDEDI